MRVSLNALALRPDGAGVSTYIRELLAAMPTDWQAACTAFVQSDAVKDLPTAVTGRAVSPRAGVRRAVAGLLLRPDGPGLMHALDVDVPVRVSGPVVITVHDVSVFDTPWAFGPVRVRGERALVRHALRRADLVLADSYFTADRIKALFGRGCVVIPLAASTDMRPADEEDIQHARRRYGLPTRFVLHVGSVEPRKDVPKLADACRDLGLPLVLAGGGGSAYLPSTGIHRLGFVPRRDLPALYGAATVSAYVSLYEGFGLPPVEALACGANVVSTQVADLRELLGDSVTWAAGHAVGQLTQALRQAVGEPAAGPPSRLTWHETAAATIQAYRELGADPAGEDEARPGNRGPARRAPG